MNSRELEADAIEKRHVPTPARPAKEAIVSLAVEKEERYYAGNYIRASKGVKL